MFAPRSIFLCSLGPMHSLALSFLGLLTIRFTQCLIVSADSQKQRAINSKMPSFPCGPSPAAEIGLTPRDSSVSRSSRWIFTEDREQKPSDCPLGAGNRPAGEGTSCFNNNNNCSLSVCACFRRMEALARLKNPRQEVNVRPTSVL